MIPEDEGDSVYVDPDITDSVNYQQPVMPPMPEGLSGEQVMYIHNICLILHRICACRVRTGHGKPGKSWNFRTSFLRLMVNGFVLMGM